MKRVLVEILFYAVMLIIVCAAIYLFVGYAWLIGNHPLIALVLILSAFGVGFWLADKQTNEQNEQNEQNE